MKQKLVSIKNETNDYEVRTELLDGKEYWVVPVVMLVEGVHNGNQGPLLYPVEELARFPASWNGIPVVIDHPEEGSANDPNLVKEVVGRIFNTHMEGLKLKAEAWIDIEQLQLLSEDAYEYIKEHKALEVSTGAFFEAEGEPGEFNNEEYRAIARHIRPDHLALLPNGVGACSWDDGCGVRVNKQNKKGVKNVKTKEKDLEALGIYKLAKEGYPDSSLYVSKELVKNEVGFREIMQNLQQKLDQLDNDIRIHFLEELFDDHVIYRTHNRESGETKFFKRDYVVNDDGSVEFDGDPVEVRKETTFQTVQNKTKNKMKRTKDSVKPCSVDLLIENEATHWKEEDREWLESLEQEQLEKFTPVVLEQKVAGPNDDDPAEGDDAQGEGTSKTAKVKQKRNPSLQVLEKLIRKNLKTRSRRFLAMRKILKNSLTNTCQKV